VNREAEHELVVVSHAPWQALVGSESLLVVVRRVKLLYGGLPRCGSPRAESEH